MRTSFTLALAFAVAVSSYGCKRPDVRKDETRGTTSAAPIASGALPSVTESSTGQVYTWIDSKGDYATGESTKDVPLVGRDIVRVQDPSKEEPEDMVFIADLRNTRPDGTYAVRTMSRRELDDFAEARRKAAGKKTLAQNDEKPTAPEPTDHAAPEASAQANVAAERRVIIYGASWCGPCHSAADYLKRKGVPFVLKDIDEDSSAQREMTIKLAKAGLRGSGIPVIDVRGRILVGFSASQIDAALAASPM